MSASITVDTREFQTAMRQYLGLTSRTLPQALNEKAFYIALGALDVTAKSNRAVIEELGVDGYRVVKSKKTGTLRQGRPIYNKAARARAIYLSRKFKGTGDEIQKQARNFYTSSEAIHKDVINFLGARLKSIGFLKSGWLPAIRKLVAATGYSRGKIPVDVKQKGRPKGRALVAKENSVNPVVEIENNATPTGKQGQQAMAMMTAALQKAFDRETASMREYIARKLQKDADKFNAK